MQSPTRAAMEQTPHSAMPCRHLLVLLVIVAGRSPKSKKAQLYGSVIHKWCYNLKMVLWSIHF
jgi:hypothetical protein